MTYGQLKFILTREAPGADLDLLEAWIDARYAEVLDRLPWERLRRETTLVTVPSYAEGIVAVTHGESGVSLSGGSWSGIPSGRRIRIANRTEWYVLTVQSQQNGMLDRPYAGPSASDASYAIFQPIYALPPETRFVEGIRGGEPPRELKRISRSEMNAAFAARTEIGEPAYWSAYMDDDSDPPRMQVELYPAPRQARTYTVLHVADPLLPSEAPDSPGLFGWLVPRLILEGVRADILAHRGDYAGSDRAEARFQRMLEQMVKTDCYRRGAAHWRLAERLTRCWRPPVLTRTRYLP